MPATIDALKSATTIRDLATILDLKLSLLTFVLYIKPREELYTCFSIPKRHGGERQISAPHISLKVIQQRLAILLSKCWAEICEKHGHVEDAEHQGISHGFKKYHTIMTNGRPHVGRRYVFNVDLADFFGTINFGRVRTYFINNKNFQLHADIATAIAQIACYDNRLPQGSPCSPVISNFIAHGMDTHLVKLARESGVTYTRYADDLTFSTNMPAFPPAIATSDSETGWVPGARLAKIVQKSGFNFAPSKTRMQYCDSHQEVTGLTVNRKINVPASYRYTVRSMVHSLFRKGTFSFIYKKRDATGANVVVNDVPGSKPQLHGMLSYIDQVDLFNHSIQERAGMPISAQPGRVKLFRQFIYYDRFYSADKPLIICEGKTDIVYLRCAIKSLAASYPVLASGLVNPKLNVDFFKYADRRITDITEINGGYGGLCKFIQHYSDDIQRKFRFGPPPKHPVIIFIDNDSGAHAVYGKIAGITKKAKPTGHASFIHVIGNLYVVPTPFAADGGQTDIECFFTKETLEKPVDGRTFNKKSDEDSDKFYGKATFSIKVVAKNAATIEFKNFHPLLSRIAAVVEHYAANIKP